MIVTSRPHALTRGLAADECPYHAHERPRVPRLAGVSALKKLQEAKEFLAKSESTPPPTSVKSPSKQADRPPKVDLFK